MPLTPGAKRHTIRTADASDIPKVVSLLEASALPTVGVETGSCTLLIAEADDVIVGVVGLELRDRYALLRSTAVAHDWRGQGVGRGLVQRAIVEARARGVEALYLLTTTAESYFPSFGFARITRDDVPAEIRGTEEFTDACPASAIVMSLLLAEAND